MLKNARFSNYFIIVSPLEITPEAVSVCCVCMEEVLYDGVLPTSPSKSASRDLTAVA